MEPKQFERKGMHELEYGTASRKALAIGKPLLLTTLLVAGGLGLTKLLSRLVSDAKR